MAQQYKWGHPAAWLTEKINGFEPLEFAKLRDFAIAMAGALDSDAIQDAFESDMDDDGYFQESPEFNAEQFVAGLDRADVIKLLESISIQCYDTESDETLRAALVVNIVDETIDIETAQEVLVVVED